MNLEALQSHRRRHGFTIIGVLFFVLVLSILLIGTATLVMGHQVRAQSDSSYAAAVDAADSGVNYELNVISANPSNANQSPGTTVAPTGWNGSFTVYCTNRDGSTPWTAPNSLYIVSQGTVNGVSRTVKVTAKGFPWPGKYAIYTMDSISIWRGSALDINGDVGSNGNLDFTAQPTVSGDVYFDGPNAGWYNSAPTGYTVIDEPQPIVWPTVDQIANSTVSGGMATLAVTNSNANAIPPIVGNSITSSVTLVGPGNYYITNMNLTGNQKITFNNANGPVNLWIGPDGGSGTANFRGGTAAVTVSSNAADANHIYVATRSGLNLAGNETIEALIYSYNVDASGNPYGEVQNSGNPTIDGQIIANTVDINGNVTVNYVTPLIQPTNFMYYGYDNSWQEVNPRNPD